MAGLAVYTIDRIRCWGTSRVRPVAAPSAPRSTSGSPKVCGRTPPRCRRCRRGRRRHRGRSRGRRRSPVPRTRRRRRRRRSSPGWRRYSASSPSAWISLMSTPAQKPRPSARRINHTVVRHATGGEHRLGETEPAGDVEGVHRGVVDDDLGDAGSFLMGGDGHGGLRGSAAWRPDRPGRGTEGKVATHSACTGARAPGTTTGYRWFPI